MNIFERAAREKLRFPSIRGDLTVENLWEMKLTAQSGFDLDTVAKAVNTALKACSEESFVATVENPMKDLLALKLEVVKYVIDVKLAEQKARAEANEKAAKKAKLMEKLAEKQDEQLSQKSVQELMAEINALG